jgi:hypothetical protein
VSLLTWVYTWEMTVRQNPQEATAPCMQSILGEGKSRLRGKRCLLGLRNTRH